MTEAHTRRVLVPSFTRALVRVFLSTVAVAVASGFLQRWQTGQWWSFGYCLSLLIPLTIFPLVVCVAFVPRRIEWSEAEFFIQTRARTGRFAWEQLHAYSSSDRGFGVYLLQFTGAATFQIYLGAFEPAQWGALREFLVTTYPSKRATF